MSVGSTCSNGYSPLNFQHIKTGKSQSSALVLFEDSYGFIWAGTPNGLDKYDGTDFEIYEKRQDGKTGLTNGSINSIYEDGGDLYIVTNRGLSLFDRKLNLVKPFEFKNSGRAI